MNGSLANSGSRGDCYDLGGGVPGWTYETGVDDQAIEFGGGGWVGVSSFRDITSQLDGFTMGMWVWLSADTTASKIFNCRSGSGGMQAYAGSTPGSIVFCADDAVAESSCSGAAFDMPKSEWHHLTLRWTKGANLEVLRDDVNVWTTPQPDGYTTAHPLLKFGRQFDDMGTGPGFRIDDFQFWGTVFTDQQVCEVLMGGTWTGICAVP